MKVTVRAFAGARDILGSGRLELELAEGATVDDVWQALCARHAALEGFRLQGLAVNRVYVEAGHPVRDGDEVAVIPPVSGG